MPKDLQNLIDKANDLFKLSNELGEAYRRSFDAYHRSRDSAQALETNRIAYEKYINCREDCRIAKFDVIEKLTKHFGLKF